MSLEVHTPGQLRDQTAGLFLILGGSRALFPSAAVAAVLLTFPGSRFSTSSLAPVVLICYVNTGILRDDR